MFKYRVPDEIVRKLNKMESPTLKFKNYGQFTVEISSNQMDILLTDAFDAGYKQAVKELKQYFGIKGNGIHAE